MTNVKRQSLLAYWFGGGKGKYRIKLLRNGQYKVECKGAGMGPFWGFACFSNFDNLENALLFARRWERRDNE